MIVTLKRDTAEIREELYQELWFSVDRMNLQCTPVMQVQKLMLHWSLTIRGLGEASKGVCSVHM